MWSDRWLEHPAPNSMSSMTTLVSAGTTGLEYSWCAAKRECCYSSFRDPSGHPSGHPLYIFATSIGEICTTELIQMYKTVLLLFTDLFFSHTSPIPGLLSGHTKLLLRTRDVLLNNSITFKDTLGSCFNSLDPTFLSFHCISEKQEAAAHKHHTSFRAWCEAHQKATGIFHLVLVGFSYRLHSF